MKGTLLLNNLFILKSRYDSNNELTLQLADIVAEQGGPFLSSNQDYCSYFS